MTHLVKPFTRENSNKDITLRGNFSLRFFIKLTTLVRSRIMPPIISDIVSLKISNVFSHDLTRSLHMASNKIRHEN